MLDVDYRFVVAVALGGLLALFLAYRERRDRHRRLWRNGYAMALEYPPQPSKDRPDAR